ncbi:MAG: cell division protein ZapA [Gammaproteobacteria bacterium]|nr:cell division protein ZapA [Gammaproteobacteria bacterium]
MMDNKQNVTVTIMDRDFAIKCHKEEIKQLHDSASYVDNIMRKMVSGDKVINVDSLWAVTTLNIASELLDQKKFHDNSNKSINDELQCLQSKIEQALNNK